MTAVILASGPSLRQSDADAVGAARARNPKLRALAINDCWRLAPWADALYGADPEWWITYGFVPEFAGQKWTQDKNWLADFKIDPSTRGLNVARMNLDEHDGIATRPGWVRKGGPYSNSGFQALNLVTTTFGARRVILLGYDMKGTHWFGKHPPGLRSAPEEHHAGRIKGFAAAAPALAEMGIDVVNASRDTAMTVFPRVSLERALG